MGLLNRIVSFFDDWHPSPVGSVMDMSALNPATGLPMIGGIDVAGNQFGTDLSSHRHDDRHHDQHRSASLFDDHHTGWHDPFLGSMGGGHDPWRD